MNVMDALNSRFTCRTFKPEPVDRNTIYTVLEGALRAPSWANTQPWEIFVASGSALQRLREAYLGNFSKNVPVNPDISRPQEWPPALKERTQELGRKRFNALGIDRNDEQGRRALTELNFKFFGAPTVIFLCMDRTLTAWSMFDLGLLAQSIMLAAAQYGLGTATAVQMAAYPDLIRAELGVPPELAIVIGIALGYIDYEHPQNKFRSPRRPISEVVRFIDL
ncbi:Nitroreductase NfnB [Neomoorella glycerini]|uniref:Nitroreductase NfnB n=1 Tax=Neomoorella glycerini TaxID=55779 RepID=A0A6I5ZMS6_9FIRM|nr:nitroreductase [Moorella glycerini]QGP91146.1 Nitroreductase NfnB [Moorella glycerini]